MISALLLALALLCWPVGGAAGVRLAAAVPPVLGTASPRLPGGPRSGTGAGEEGRRDPVAAYFGRLADRIPELDAVRRRFAARKAPPATADDAWAVELLAAAYAGGLDTASALRAVSLVAPGKVARAFGRAASMVAMGQGVGGALREEGAASAVIPRVGEALERSAGAGGSVAEALRRAAAHARTQAAMRRRAAAERAGVLIAGPLGACFLPAFVCLGVAPVVLGLAGRILPEVLP